MASLGIKLSLIEVSHNQGLTISLNYTKGTPDTTRNVA